MRFAYTPYTLQFKQPAITSRATMREKLTYLVKVWDERYPEIFGIGEAPLFKGLSCDDVPGYEYKMVETLANVALGRATDLTDFPSIQFGLEQALLDLGSGGRGIYFPSKFTEGESTIEINGLVWMGNIGEMTRRLEEKISAGFKCVKLKIGALEWNDERKLIESIRKKFSPDELEIRVDANGGFSMEEVFPVLKQLADLHVHSIEQPIPAGNHELMAFVVKMSPIPVALDEELIGLNKTQDKIQMMETIHPHYIILKPALCGGFSGAAEWIDIATSMGIGWWVTSALESNIGLDALAQWTATLSPTIPQGLGTGALYTNNFSSPLHLNGDRLSYNPYERTSREVFNNLNWRE